MCEACYVAHCPRHISPSPSCVHVQFADYLQPEILEHHAVRACCALVHNASAFGMWPLRGVSQRELNTVDRSSYPVRLQCWFGSLISLVASNYKKLPDGSQRGHSCKETVSTSLDFCTVLHDRVYRVVVAIEVFCENMVPSLNHAATLCQTPYSMRHTLC